MGFYYEQPQEGFYYDQGFYYNQEKFENLTAIIMKKVFFSNIKFFFFQKF